MPKHAASSRPAKKARTAASAPAATPSQAVDQQLARYRAMRDFAMTAEPRGSSSEDTPAQALPFVIQKHAATRLHYDFRLGWRGVLKSWAVAKGPSYNPSDKRLAVEVEDHPIEYGGFEGAIPKGQYGGGTVMVWDQGTWEPLVDVDEGLRAGNLKFALHGSKLRGHWTLIRMNSARFARSDKPNWLLIKEHDEFERGPNDPTITDEAPDSTVTGRSLDQIAAAEDHVWNSNHPEQPEQKAGLNRSRLTRQKKQLPPVPTPVTDPVTDPVAGSAAPGDAPRPDAGLQPEPPSLTDQPKAKMPEQPVPPQLATLTDHPPEGEAWLHELKLDGYRIQFHIEHAKSGAKPRIRLFTRKGLDWTHRMTAIAEAAARLPVHSAILDGEVVVLDEQGRTSFALLQAAFEEGAPHPLTYFAFDLLYLDGRDLRTLPLERRKALLEEIFRHYGDDPVLRYSSHIRAQGGEMFSRACRLGAEGVVSKLASAPYRSARTRDWLKSKCVLQQEFVVGGFTLPSNGSHGIGSLLLGYYQGSNLIYAGRTGTGFTRATHQLLRDRLDPLRQAKTPFHRPPAEARKNALWVQPSLVVEVRFATWTAGNNVRQAAFLGLREDKVPEEVVREAPASAPRTQPRAQRLSSLKPRSTPEPSAQSAPARRAAARHASTQPVAAKTRRNSAPAKAPAEAATKPWSRPAAAEALQAPSIHLTHPDKILDEESRLTKQQLAAYYAAVADHILPHIAGRPLSLVRCPEGSTKPCFFQKHIGLGVPAGVDSVPVPPKNGGQPEQYLTISTAEGLTGLAQMGVLEIHPWGSRNESLETPDRLIIDLDPDPSLPFERVVRSALEVRDLMKNLDLETFVKSTGGKGIHVVAPLQPDREWPAIKDFAHNFVLMMERANPSLYLTKMTKSARTGRIFLDYLRNERGATAVAPFSPRARAGARVAMPLTWTELGRTDPKQFSVASFSDWKSRLRRDPWLAMNEVHQPLTEQAITAVAQMAAAGSA